MARIVFVNSTVSYDGNSLRCGPLGGVESATVQLSEALVARGHDLTVLTAARTATEVNGVTYRPAGEGTVEADLVIVNNVGSDLYFVKAPRRVVWIHNTRAFDRFLRKGGPGATFRYWPAAVYLGAYHKSTISRFIPYRRRIFIPYAVGQPFTTADPGDSVPRAPRAIHFSQPYRDAQNLVRIWLEAIHPAVPRAEFHIFGGDWRPEGYSDETLAAGGIMLQDRLSKDGLVEEMRQARVMLYRGYKDETFCLAAAESIAMGVPVVTAGIGSLRERVLHGETGLIGETDERFAEAAVRVLTDDALWSRLHRGGLSTRESDGWDVVAARWEEAFLKR